MVMRESDIDSELDAEMQRLVLIGPDQESALSASHICRGLDLFSLHVTESKVERLIPGPNACLLAALYSVT